MAKNTAVTEKILEVVARTAESDFEELMSACPEFTWNQVFLAVDELSRTGRISLKAKGTGVYVITTGRLLTGVT